MTASSLPRVERDEDGTAHFLHVCSWGKEVLAVLPTTGDGWTWTEDGGLTPSIQCLGCDTHGFWVGGDVPAWRPC